MLAAMLLQFLLQPGCTPSTERAGRARAGRGGSPWRLQLPARGRGGRAVKGPGSTLTALSQLRPPLCAGEMCVAKGHPPAPPQPPLSPPYQVKAKARGSAAGQVRASGGEGRGWGWAPEVTFSGPGRAGGVGGCR